ncbi:MAG: TraB/GumN family protein [Oscillospiraceae bacterium]|nr:TraB/GumN family protein [Oscillospiraceae bacterium]
MKSSKIIALILVFVMAVSTVAMASPLAPIYNTYVDGEAFVPLRATAYAFGAEVEWVDATRSVIITFAAGDYEVVAVEAIGGFIMYNMSWIPLAFAIELFYGEEDYERPQIHGMLTRIEYNDNVAYIFGSMHAGRPNWFPLHPMVEDAMARADIFGFEVDMNEMMDLSEEQLEAIAALQIIPDGLTLEDILPEDVFENFITNFESFSAIGLQYEYIATLRPIALTAALEMIMLALTGTEIGIGDHMVDGYIAEFARANDRPIMGFENIVDQAYLLFDVPMELQVYALVDFPDFETMLSYFEGEYGLAEAYERQDIDALRAILESGWSSYGDPLMQHMHYIHWDYRDRIYANGIAELLRNTEEPTTFFFTFGISHIMGGNTGIVLYLLEDMGFDVVPLWK